MWNLIPDVASLTPGNGEFCFTGRIVARTAGAHAVAELLAEYFTPVLGTIPVVSGEAGKAGDIVLEESDVLNADAAGLPDESYAIRITPESARLSAQNRFGLCRAIQTLRQLMDARIYGQEPAECCRKIACVAIDDAPKFRWRGLHFDVSRHFFSVDEVCRYIELLAQHRMNTLHWHLTDDQGWRVEIKKYPRLAQVGSRRLQTLVGHHNQGPHHFDGKPSNGYYTQDELKTVVAFAARRGVNIVPEIDMPGHMQAALAAYPELSNNPTATYQVRSIWGISENILNPSPETIRFMQDVLGEIMDIFPSHFIHIGGDEALKYEWNNNVYPQQRMAELGLKDAHELQSYFIGEMGKTIAARGRTLMGWDEILEGGLCDNAAVTSWRGNEHALNAARQRHFVVNAWTQYTYLDYYQADPKVEPLAIGGDLPCEKVYRFSPIPAELEAEFHPYILGGQGQIWTEYMPDFACVERMAYPRACALSEVLWYRGEPHRFRNFTDRLTAHRARLAMQNVHAHDLP